MPPSISPSLPPPFLWIINQSLSPGDSVAHQDTFQCCASRKLFSFFLHRQTIFLLSPITWVTGSSLFKGKAYLTVFLALFVLNSPAHKCSSDKKKKKTCIHALVNPFDCLRLVFLTCSSSTFKDPERASLRDSGHGDSDQADSDQDTNKGSCCDMSAKEALKMKATGLKPQPLEQGESFNIRNFIIIQRLSCFVFLCTFSQSFCYSLVVGRSFCSLRVYSGFQPSPSDVFHKCSTSWCPMVLY